MLLFGKYYFGKIRGYGFPKEESLRVSTNRHKHSVLINKKYLSKVKKAFDSGKNIFLKFDKSITFCEHHFELVKGNSKYGSVCCKNCGVLEVYDYRTLEDIELLFKKARLEGVSRELEQLERKKEELEETKKELEKALQDS